MAVATRSRLVCGALIVFGVTLTTTWLALRFLGLPALAQAEVARSAGALVGGIAVAAALIRGSGRELAPSLGRPRLVDLTSVAVLTVILLALIKASIPPVAIGGAMVIAVAGYPSLRRAALRLAERVMLAELRERMTIEAAEAERAKLARELHDAPLQELAGVINRLDRVPHTQSEGEALRGIAEQLREVAVALHPPVLDDLGLAPAIQFLVSQPPYRDADARIALDITDQTGLGPTARPPKEVELTIFRILQEAVGNAQRHSGASFISIAGEVTAYRVALRIQDDGLGIDRHAAELALRAGRLGLSSMRRRAESIGASLDFHSKPRKGTQIMVVWDI